MPSTSSCSTGLSRPWQSHALLSPSTKLHRLTPGTQRSKRLRVSCVAEPVEGDVAELEEVPDSYVVPRAAPTPLLDPSKVVEELYDAVHDEAAESFRAFFSSEVGGITTDPALMVVHIDDHMVHRGHAVFDTATLINGYVYQLERHLDRLLNSAELAGISPYLTRDQMRRTILDTAAASKQLNGHIKFWMGAGRGGFGLSPLECDHSTFYCVVYRGAWPDLPAPGPDLGMYGGGSQLLGWRVKTSPVPSKHPFFAAVKSTNYLLNALNLLDAQMGDFDQGVFIDEEGYILEGPNWNIGFITADKTLVIPPFEAVLQGITMTRLLELAPKYLESGELQGVKAIEQRPVHLSEVKGMREVFGTSSSLPVMPIVRWDGEQVGTGFAGEGVLSLRAIIFNDLSTETNDPRTSGEHTEVNYGVLTDMEGF